jgi:hypothetical protein
LCSQIERNRTIEIIWGCFGRHLWFPREFGKDASIEAAHYSVEKILLLNLLSAREFLCVACSFSLFIELRDLAGNRVEILFHLLHFISQARLVNFCVLKLLPAIFPNSQVLRVVALFLQRSSQRFSFGDALQYIFSSTQSTLLIRQALPHCLYIR